MVSHHQNGLWESIGRVQNLALDRRNGETGQCSNGGRLEFGILV